MGYQQYMEAIAVQFITYSLSVSTIFILGSAKLRAITTR